MPVCICVRRPSARCPSTRWSAWPARCCCTPTSSRCWCSAACWQWLHCRTSGRWWRVRKRAREHGRGRRAAFEIPCCHMKRSIWQLCVGRGTWRCTYNIEMNQTVESMISMFSRTLTSFLLMLIIKWQLSDLLHLSYWKLMTSLVWSLCMCHLQSQQKESFRFFWRLFYRLLVLERGAC